jgi:hypothetical protein
MNEQDLLFFNGINGSTGDYLLPPMTPEQVAMSAMAVEFNPEQLQDIELKKPQVEEPDLAPIEGVDPKDLA